MHLTQVCDLPRVRQLQTEPAAIFQVKPFPEEPLTPSLTLIQQRAPLAENSSLCDLEGMIPLRKNFLEMLHCL